MATPIFFPVPVVEAWDETPTLRGLRLLGPEAAFADFDAESGIMPIGQQAERVQSIGDGTYRYDPLPL